jgi:hypothetical protein
MLEVMEFIFSSFWTWLGTVILVAVAGASLGGLPGIAIRLQGKEKK